jgi:hypothetical protein
MDAAYRGGGANVNNANKQQLFRKDADNKCARPLR